jgi:hypothetical protein
MSYLGAGLMLPLQYHFCTYFDRNYLTRGLVLYRSLMHHCQRPFTLWVLCFDADTYQTLDRLHLPGMSLISLEQFEAGDLDLQRAKAERSLVEYFWTCTPSLPLYILDHHPEVHLITYLDADLCFYADPLPIYVEMGNQSILIVEHRYTSEHAYLVATSGIYNVGLLTFRRDDRGLACLRWWRDRCLEWCFMRFEDGKFGDQKYLDDWPQRLSGVVVLQHKGADLAPWNAAQYCIEWNEGHLVVGNAPLIFYHFHGFKTIARNVVQSEYMYRLSPLLIEYLYFPYIYALWEAEQDITVGESRIHLEGNSNWLRLLPGLLEQRWLLVTPKSLGLAFWKLGERQHDRLLTGFEAYRLGDLPTARRLCFLALLRNPFDLLDRQIMSILARTTLKPNQILFLKRCVGERSNQEEEKDVQSNFI